MDKQQQQGSSIPSQADDGGTPAARAFWRMVALVFAGLLAVDIYWVATGGFAVFVSNVRFQWLALATFALFIALAWRVTLGRFRTGFLIDRRDDMDFSRSQWRSRWRRGDG